MILIESSTVMRNSCIGPNEAIEVMEKAKREDQEPQRVYYKASITSQYHITLSRAKNGMVGDEYSMYLSFAQGTDTKILQ